MLAFNGGAAPRAAKLSRDEPAVLTVIGGRIVAADGPACRLVGAAATHQLIGRHLADFVAPGWADGPPPAETRSQLVTVVRLDGELLVSEWRSRPSRWRGRTATRFALWPLDGDPRRIERLVTGGAAPAEAVVTADRRFGIRSFSARAEELFGQREPAVLHRCITDVLSVGDGLDAALDGLVDQLRRTGRWQGQAAQRRSDGRRFPALVSATVVRDTGGRDLGTVWDVRVTSGAGSPA